MVLEHHGLLAGHQAICHPGFADQLADPSRAQEPVVMDGACLTSRGAGTAVTFALALVERLYNRSARDAVAATLAL